MPRNHRGMALLLVSLTVLPSGCDNGEGYQAVSGSVTFQGEPLKEGTIQFFTTGERPAPYAGAAISQGKYKVPKDHGLKPGKYLVTISSTEKVANTKKGGSSLNPFLARERIPSKYNTKSTLGVEVRVGERGQFDFDLK